MKHITASDARQNWFRLLDEVIEGEVFVIVRNGQRIVIRREAETAAVHERRPDYGDIVSAPDLEDADAWTWEWTGPDDGLRLRDDDE